MVDSPFRQNLSLRVRAAQNLRTARTTEVIAVKSGQQSRPWITPTPGTPDIQETASSRATLPRIENGTFEWHAEDHSLSILGALGHLFYSGTMVDVTLACADGILKAHQTMLAASSPYFQTLFMSNPSHHPIVFMHNLKLSAVKNLIDFMYHGSISCSVEDLQGILEAAKVLQVSPLDRGNSTDIKVRGLDQLKIPMENGLRPSDRGHQGFAFPSSLVPSPFFAAASAFTPHLSPAAQVALANLLTSTAPVVSSQPARSTASSATSTTDSQILVEGSSLSQSAALSGQSRPKAKGRPKKGQASTSNPTLVRALETPTVNSVSKLAAEVAVDLSSALDGLKQESVSTSTEDSRVWCEERSKNSPCDLLSPSATALPKSCSTGSQPKKRGRKPKPRVIPRIVTFVCLEEAGKGRYNALYNEKARQIALKSGWELLVDRERRTLRGNSKDRSKGIMEKSRQVLEFRIPEDLIQLSEKGRYDWLNPLTQEKGRIHDPRFTPQCFVLTLKGLVRLTQATLKKEASSLSLCQSGSQMMGGAMGGLLAGMMFGEKPPEGTEDSGSEMLVEDEENLDVDGEEEDDADDDEDKPQLPAYRFFSYYQKLM
ncbi:unnamed protein product [Cyprideis torosa]|uniref:Uncharacterized protein n=1 Tax=Cyprideis torosa TaxID=163714 RepID=A0A7R8ZGU4_9CRUS|nr:unnamed protein product [Cyprideis torosa]CAG0882199.1 unnamed protein product [Cyprideis torosa]